MNKGVIMEVEKNRNVSKVISRMPWQRGERRNFSGNLFASSGGTLFGALSNFSRLLGSCGEAFIGMFAAAKNSNINHTQYLSINDPEAIEMARSSDPHYFARLVKFGGAEVPPSMRGVYDILRCPTTIEAIERCWKKKFSVTQKLFLADIPFFQCTLKTLRGCLIPVLPLSLKEMIEKYPELFYCNNRRCNENVIEHLLENGIDVDVPLDVGWILIPWLRLVEEPIFMLNPGSKEYEESFSDYSKVLDLLAPYYEDIFPLTPAQAIYIAATSILIGASKIRFASYGVRLAPKLTMVVHENDVLLADFNPDYPFFREPGRSGHPWAFQPDIVNSIDDE